MPRNNHGLYVLPPGNPVVSGTTIESVWANTTMDDVGEALTSSLPRDGSAPMTGPLTLSADAITASRQATTKEYVDQFMAYASGLPVGFVTAYGGTSSPLGWLLCDGSAVSRTAYPVLFGIIGTNFGAGDGSTTFNVPNLPGDFIRGRYGSRAVGSKQAGSFAAHVHAVSDPNHSHTGSVSQVPHSHTLATDSHTHGVTDPGHAHSYVNAAAGGGISAGSGIGPVNQNTSTNVAGISIQMADALGGLTDTQQPALSAQVNPAPTGISLGATGGSETVPQNTAMDYYIKAINDAAGSVSIVGITSNDPNAISILVTNPASPELDIHSNVAFGLAKLDASAKLPLSLMPTSSQQLIGYFDASGGNNPSQEYPTQTFYSGDTYVVAADGTILVYDPVTLVAAPTVVSSGYLLQYVTGSVTNPTGWYYIIPSSTVVASQVGYVPSGSLTSTDVQGAIDELVVAVDNPEFVQAGTSAVTRTAQSKMREPISIKDFGAVCDGSTDDAVSIQTTINNINALAYHAAAEITGVSKSTSVPSNPLGVPLIDGKVIVPSSIVGFDTQYNTYAPDANGLVVGRENLAAFRLSIGANTAQNVFVFGDSTVEMDAGYPVKSHVLIRLAMQESGINYCDTINRGVSGTSWVDLNALPDLGPNTKLIVIKYGINDAVKTDPLATLAGDARNKLAAIRGHAQGGYNNLSIIIMGPSSTYKPSTLQDYRWYEDLRNVYVQLAKDFDCVYFDTYAYMQSTRYAPGLWLDSIPPYSEGIHPTPEAAYWLWYETFKHFIFGDGTWNPNKANHFWNRNIPNFTEYPTTQPSGFPRGVTIDAVTAANGWPANGCLTTTRQASAGNLGYVTQELVTLDVVPKRFFRTGADASWTQWATVPSTPTLLNSWVDKGGGYAAAGYMCHDDGFVEMFGVLTGGTIGLSCFLLPTTLRPGQAHIFPCTSGGTITVFSDGNVITAGGTNTTVSLDGMRFRYGA